MRFFLREDESSLAALIASGRHPLQLRKIRKLLREGRINPSTAGWFARFYFGKRDADWYADLLKPPEGQISGEVCHAYSGMTTPQLRAMKEAYPDLKLIYLIREPISRCWSGLTRNLQAKKQQSIDPLWDAETIIALMRSLGVIEKSSYANAIERFISVFPRDQIFIGVLDDFRDNPLTFLADICNWLGVEDYRQAVPAGSHPQTGGATYAAMPDAVRRELAGILSEPTERLCQLVKNPYTHSWVCEQKSAP